MTTEPQTLTVAELFQNDSYHIPIYQRNYAWGEQEIEQLLQDLLDMAGRNSASRYYIGSLVAWQRPGAKPCFETIDGQQRHTTLALILAVFKHRFRKEVDGLEGFNLHFDARPGSEDTLRRLFRSSAPHESDEPALRAGYEIALHFLGRIPEARVNQLWPYFLNQVMLLRTVVPGDTDLNHYFEIMNNRGEQLEMHEIQKARFLERLPPEHHRAFSAVWDACSNMNGHVQLNFPKQVREKLFGLQGNAWPADPRAVLKAWDKITEIAHEKSLREIIHPSSLQDNTGDKQIEDQEDGITSIINFPNFLLHVLRLCAGTEVSLDDKYLLECFDKNHVEAETFMHKLLKCRFLFDRYVIKRSQSDHWILQRAEADDTRVNTFGREDRDEAGGINQQLSMLLSMFHVSFPAQAYKHWLAGVLLYLNAQERVDGPAYLGFLERLSDRFLFGRLCERPLDYEELLPDAHLPAYEVNKSILHGGTQVPNFVFNRLDYLLWKKIEVWKISKDNGEFQGAGMDMRYVEARHKKFRFSFRSSVEHYYPQHPSPNVKLNEDKLKHGVDSFANLCLISHSQNSRLSNLLPQAKKEHCDARYHAGHFTESLKQVLMMSHKGWGPGHEEEMLRHGEMMIRILMERGQA